MATSITGIPVEEYLRTSYEPDMEYVNGQLVERHVGEYIHSWLQGLIYGVLAARGQGRFRVFAELRVQVSDEPRFRIPDVCAKALPHEKRPILLKPDLVVEVLSPDDRPGEILEKIADYAAAGVPYIWIIDPYQRTLSSIENGMHQHVTGSVLATPLVGAVDFGDLFRQLDE
jgi:Uma2 family endonuclease